MSEVASRPVIPLANPDTQPFWDGCLRGELLVQRCSSCEALRHPPAPICPRCLSAEHRWIPLTGKGTIYSYVVVREPLARGWDQLVPYVLAVIELEEGVRYLSNVVNVVPEDVVIGMPVELLFAKLDGTTRLPLFQPSGARH